MFLVEPGHSRGDVSVSLTLFIGKGYWNCLNLQHLRSISHGFQEEFTITNLYSNYLYKSVGDSALLSVLETMDANQRRVVSGSHKYVQFDSTHLGSWQPNELPAEAPSTAAATHHRPGTHSPAPEVSFFLQGRHYYQVHSIAGGDY